MIKPLNFRALGVLFLVNVVVGVGVYMIKSNVKDQSQELRVIEAQIDEEKSRITVLEADWSYLTRPSRIQHLAKEMLDFAPVEPERILTLDRIDGETTTEDDELFQIKTITGIE